MSNGTEFTINGEVKCLVCDDQNGGFIRLNSCAEEGLWACLKHQSLFRRGDPTDKIRQRAEAIKSKMFAENKDART